MLIEKISNHFVRFRVLGGDENAKEAFLYVVAAYDAYKFPKEKMLGCIVEECPEVFAEILEEVSFQTEIFKAFKLLYQNLLNRNELLSPAEFDWVSRYVKSQDLRKEMEKILYYSLLVASRHHDKVRRNFEWTIGEKDIEKIVKKILDNPSLRSKRKMEIAEEFDESSERFKIKYFKKLLWDRHYDKAEKLGINNSEVVLQVVLSNIDATYFEDAIQVASRFLSDSEGIVEEIKSIQAMVT